MDFSLMRYAKYVRSELAHRPLVWWAGQPLVTAKLAIVGPTSHPYILFCALAFMGFYAVMPDLIPGPVDDIGLASLLAAVVNITNSYLLKIQEQKNQEGNHTIDLTPNAWTEE